MGICATIDFSMFPVNEVSYITFMDGLVSVSDHRSEFEEDKPLARKTHSLLTKQDGTRGSQLGQNRNDEHQWRGNNNPKKRTYNVEDSLREPIEREGKVTT
jgi:hypothetical protein